MVISNKNHMISYVYPIGLSAKIGSIHKEYDLSEEMIDFLGYHLWMSGGQQPPWSTIMDHQ